LQDELKLLVKPGENTQLSRLIKFTAPNQISEIEDILKAYIFEAIEIEKSGVTIEKSAKNEVPVPEEFKQKMDENAHLKTAFYALTPGRQKAYNIFFAAPKQAKTRIQRVEKYTEQILKGIGLHDKYGK